MGTIVDTSKGCLGFDASDLGAFIPPLVGDER